MKKAAVAAQMNSDNDKDSDLRTQYQTVYLSFKERPKTMLDVSLETGILRANICRYVADMEDKGIIQLLYKTVDEHTKFTAGYYTTDKSLFGEVDDRQLKLWGDE
ncbi:hypothetical protein [Bacteroides sp.]|uniref:hypothetical protein n=1 Tax=Bacteroides sp. TaxID=29523 RepID=UPI00258E16C4|nr:hypothetical protein [Bacteroides sp.]